MNPPRLLALGASVRASGHGARLLGQWAQSSATLEEYSGKAAHHEKNFPSQALSNTEILSGALLCGARSEGAGIEYISLKEALEQKEDNRLETVLSSSDALALASPVYFGDRSSLCARFFQKAREKKWLQNKAVAVASCGAKRHGGQETTNVLALAEAIGQGALAVGNGPPVSQFGGTAIGGDMATVLKDEWGLETAFATGKRLVQVARLIQASRLAGTSAQGLTRIAVLLTSDTTEQSGLKRLREMLSRLRVPGVVFEILSLQDKNIEPCIACDICPIPELSPQTGEYACIIHSSHDAMPALRERLLLANGLIIAGVNPANGKSLLSRFELFNERTRFIRRNDFELTNVPVASFLLEEAGADQNALLPLRTLIAYLRHNAVVFPPMKEVFWKGNPLIDASDGMIEFALKVQHWRLARGHTEKVQVSYRAGGQGGYRDTRLDQTSQER